MTWRGFYNRKSKKGCYKSCTSCDKKEFCRKKKYKKYLQKHLYEEHPTTKKYGIKVI